MDLPPTQVAIAILYRHNQFLMQLRDNLPGIVYPGCWGLFGGHIEPGETPLVALQRELQEEIGYTPEVISKFGCYSTPEVVRHVFQAALSVSLQDLTLGEGWDMDLLTPTQICQGWHYSKQAGQERPLGRPHQGILLDSFRQEAGHPSS